jgi:TPR repeat protein
VLISRVPSSILPGVVLLIPALFFPLAAHAQFEGVPPYPTSHPRAQNLPAQRPVVDYPPDRKDPVAMKCDELADSTLDPQRVGDGVRGDQINVDQALPVCEQAAARLPVHPRYQFLYGRVLDRAQRHDEAARQYALADQAGYALAAFNLGLLYQYGLGVEQNYQKAADLYFRAGKAGFPDAFASGGMLFTMNKSPDYAEAAAWFEHAAQGGSSRGLVYLAWLYEIGQGVRKDPAQAANLYDQAAKRGDSTGMFRLGLLYLKGVGVQKDPSTACQWIYKAAQNGLPDGEGELGNCFYFGRGMHEDHQAAFAWYMRSAQAGVPLAQELVADMYERGDGVAQSDADAVAWYRKAAAQNYPFAMARLGIHLRLGSGIEWNEAEAMKWFEKAADQGNVEAETGLAYGYMHGLGGGLQDYRLAAQWFSQAAGQGDGFAQLNLGLLNERGWGVSQDFQQARRLYLQAGESSVPEIADIGKKYAANVPDAPGRTPERTVVSSSRDSSDFWARAMVAGIVLAGVAALTSSDSTSSAGPSPPDPGPVDASGRPCYLSSHCGPIVNGVVMGDR